MQNHKLLGNLLKIKSLKGSKEEASYCKKYRMFPKKGVYCLGKKMTTI